MPEVAFKDMIKSITYENALYLNTNQGSKNKKNKGAKNFTIFATK